MDTRCETASTELADGKENIQRCSRLLLRVLDDGDKFLWGTCCPSSIINESDKFISNRPPHRIQDALSTAYLGPLGTLCSHLCKIACFLSERDSRKSILLDTSLARLQEALSAHPYPRHLADAHSTSCQSQCIVPSMS